MEIIEKPWILKFIDLPKSLEDSDTESSFEVLAHAIFSNEEIAAKVYQVGSSVGFASLETIYMVALSTFFAVLFGLPLGVILSTTKKDSINPMPRLNAVLSGLANVFRSFPFIILIIVVWPLSRLLVGSSIGPNAAIVSLSIAAIPFVARLFEGTLDEVNKGLIEATLSMGASKLAVMKMMLMESMPALLNTITVLVISVIGYSAMAGAVGGGGLGTLALNEGFNNNNLWVLYSCVIALIIIVQVAQSIGDYLSNMLRSRNYGIFKFFIPRHL